MDAIQASLYLLARSACGAACAFLVGCSSASTGAPTGASPDQGAGSAQAEPPREMSIEKARDLCVRGRQDPEGEVLDGDTVRFQIYPDGCIGSGSVEKLETSCTIASATGDRITLESRFRYMTKPSVPGGPTALPDCSGGGWAECPAGTLAPGEYTAVLGELSVSFKVPSKVSHGGACANR